MPKRLSIGDLYARPHPSQGCREYSSGITVSNHVPSLATDQWQRCAANRRDTGDGMDADNGLRDVVCRSHNGVRTLRAFTVKRISVSLPRASTPIPVRVLQ